MIMTKGDVYLSKTVQRPWGTAVLETMHLLSPRTWWGAMELQSASSFTIFQLDSLISGIISLLAPPLLLIAFIRSNIKGVLLSAIISPWTLANVATNILPQLSASSSVCHGWIRGRKEPMTEAFESLRKRMDEGRAYRCRRYDVFLPDIEQQDEPIFLCFLPGALVDYTCYAPICGQLSDKGICVVVLSMEPVRLGLTNNLGLSMERIQRVMGSVQHGYERILQSRVGRSITAGSTLRPFALAGHSLGAFGAAKMASISKQQVVSHLILWAASPNFSNEMTDLSGLKMPCLVIQASKDSICKPWNSEVEQTFTQNFATEFTVFERIVGGTHNQFASYESSSPEVDGVPDISMEEQHQRIVELTSSFLH